MRLSKRHRKPSFSMNMTPMIDIVFLLLVFFMTVSQVSEANRQSVVLPTLEGSRDQTPKAVTVNIANDQSINVSGSAVSMPQLIGMLQSEIDGKDGVADMVTVTLRVDEEAQSDTVNDVVDAVSRLMIRRIRFAVQVPQ